MITMITKYFLRNVSVILISLSFLSFHSPAWAQAGASVLEEIIVTARKREETLMETPMPA